MAYDQGQADALAEIAEMKRNLETVRRELEDCQAWRMRVQDEMTADGILRPEHLGAPMKAIHDLIAHRVAKAVLGTRDSDAGDADRRDGARWRKFCGLMAWGDFGVTRFPDGDAKPIEVDYIWQLEQMVDEGSNLRAVRGQQSEGGIVTAAMAAEAFNDKSQPRPSEGIEPHAYEPNWADRVCMKCGQPKETHPRPASGSGIAIPPQGRGDADGYTGSNTPPVASNGLPRECLQPDAMDSACKCCQRWFRALSRCTVCHGKGRVGNGLGDGVCVHCSGSGNEPRPLSGTSREVASVTERGIDVPCSRHQRPMIFTGSATYVPSWCFKCAEEANTRTVAGDGKP